MDASPWIMIGVSAAAVMTLYAFVLDIKRDREARRVAEWVSTTHADAWASLPKFQREWMKPDIGLKRLERDKAIHDPEFTRRMEILNEMQRRILRTIAIGFLLILFVVFGSRAFDWQW